VDKKPNADGKVRTFPNNPEAEQALLCCFLIDGNAVRNLAGKLSPDCFYNEKNKKIYNAICELYNNDESVDMIVVYDLMEKKGEGDDKLLEYLTNLNMLLPSGANYRQYAKLLQRDMILRTVITKCNAIIEKAYEATDADEVVDFAEKTIYEISKGINKNELVHISKPMMEVMERLEKMQKDRNAFRGLPTDFRIFDKITGGLQNGDLIILAARPSVGKTAFALNIVTNIISRKNDENKCIILYSLEMSAMQLAQRMACNMSGVSMDEIRNAELKGDGAMRLWKVTQRSSNSKVYVNESFNVTPGDIVSQCRRIGVEQNNGRVDLVVIDYLQLMTGDSTKGEVNRQQEVAALSRKMKGLARELNCPVILLSQMSRSIEQRKEKTAQLSDLRESGAIEQDADIVLFLGRENEEDRNNSPIILTIAKHRNGECGNIRLAWRGEVMTFVESTDQNFDQKAKPRMQPQGENKPENEE